MAWQFPTTVVQDPTVVPLGETDSVLVMKNVSIVSKAGVTINGSGSNHEVIVDGSVASANGQVAIFLGDSEVLDSGQKVTVSEGAFVRALEGNSAIIVLGFGCEVVNHGVVTAGNSGIHLVGDSQDTQSTLVNTGTIDGKSNGVSHAFAETLVLENSGTISGANAYISFSISTDRITNTGKMIGDVSLGGGDDLYDGRLGTINGNVLGGDGTDRLYAGVGDNRLFGQNGNDTLIGGAGADYLSGGSGADRAAYISATKAVTVSLANPAINSGDATGDVFNSVENLTGSSFNDALNGNSANNAINGGAGNDAIKGYAGNDTLTGYTGADSFIFNTALDASTNVDTITDFNVADDSIQVDNAFFTALTTPGTLAVGAFLANTTGLAADSGNRIIYETDTGNLFYDADGTGVVAGVHFAVLTAGLALSNADFIVI